MREHALRVGNMAYVASFRPPFHSLLWFIFSPLGMLKWLLVSIRAGPTPDEKAAAAAGNAPKLPYVPLYWQARPAFNE